ncbi:MAG: NADPH-dependent oxidoreductase [Senegalia sp. (in: firmicutes)]|uniref:NADPH-dependent oxidoreductase n=2 Tax=Senegalia sp. (in: firmicutes) TaxID=1924098 RepID=UPI003F94D728
MNFTIEKQLKHKSIRKFQNKEVEKETLDTLFQVANRTASSIAMQSYSMIRITDKDMKKKLSEICKQDYIKDFPEIVIFIVDVYRNARISEEKGEDLPHKKDMDRFFQGFTDGVLASQNMVNAIESLDMGTVYLGSILNDPQAIVDLLELPRLTFPIVGLGFGYPDQEPTLKPRMDVSLKLFENKYKKQDNYLESIKEYDKEMKQYYDLRNEDKPLDEFSKQVVAVLEIKNEKRSKLLNVVKSQGFNLKIED